MNIWIKTKTLVLVLLFIITSNCSEPGKKITDADDNNNPNAIQFWLSDPGQNIYFSKQSGAVDTNKVNGIENIVINKNIPLQEIDGFGFALTGGSALHINNMSASAKADLLTELFDDADKNIGISYLRVSIGASDLDEKVFSYDDLPANQTDLNLDHFTLDEDRKNLIPVLKDILQINPSIKIMGSPWSAPVWMKTNGSSIGGSLKPEYYNSYAQYFVKYIQGMSDEGIPVDAVTVQNEPLHDGNNPSMYMEYQQQSTFIAEYLGPAFAAAGISTKIVIYDHNADNPDYPINILNNPLAKSYVDGSAFHLYGGDISALSTVHDAHPDKSIYFTEQWVGAPGNFREDLKFHIRELIIGATRNWSRIVLEWNLAADENLEPHTAGGCTQCLGALTISGDMVIRNPSYYIVAHASKFVRPGSRRIYSNPSTSLPNVAFKTPQNKIVVIVMNNTNTEKEFNIIADDIFNSSLPAAAVGTFVWAME